MDAELNPGPTSSSSRSKWKRPYRGCQSGRTVRAREATKVFQYSARHDTSSSPICISLLPQFCQKVGFNSVYRFKSWRFYSSMFHSDNEGFWGVKEGWREGVDELWPHPFLYRGRGIPGTKSDVRLRKEKSFKSKQHLINVTKQFVCKLRLSRRN